jgi:two-component system sensor histidine kinase KdpD
VRTILPCEIAVFLPREGALALEAASPGFRIDPKEESVAAWVWKSGREAGQSTESLPQAWAHYAPMTTASGVRGVMGVHFDDPDRFLTPENDALLAAMASLGAMAIERIGLNA